MSDKKMVNKIRNLKFANYLEWKLFYACEIILGHKKLCWHNWVYQWTRDYEKGKTYECSKCGKWKNYGD